MERPFTEETLDNVVGVTGIELIGRQRVRFSLSGPPGPALRVLAAADVATLTMQEPTLEEIILDYYGEQSR